MGRTVTVTFDDGGTAVYQGVPDDVTPDLVEQRVASEFKGRRIAVIDGGRGASQIPVEPGANTTPTRAPEPSFGQKIIGAGEAALTAFTGATLGTVGGVLGGTQGLLNDIRHAITDPNYRGNEAKQRFEEGAMAGTFIPRTEAGQEYAGAIGEGAQNLVPIAPLAPQLAALSQGTRSAAQATAPVARAMAQTVAPAAQRAQAAVSGVVAQTAEKIGARPAQQRPTPGTQASAGSAGTDIAAQRRATAEGLGFTGETALTKGQATRDFEIQQFEKETAKRGDVGAPLRERAENQTARIYNRLDTLVESFDPSTLDDRTLGMGVDRALKNKLRNSNARVTAAYKKAREAGEMQEPIEMAPLAARLADLERFEGVAGNVTAIRKEAARLGAVVPDDAGAARPGRVSIDNSELLRQFVNDATDWTDKRQSRAARMVNESIDAATEGRGGALYQKARALRRAEAREFENVGLTRQLLGTKRGTDERQVAFDDVFKKIILDSPLEEMNKVRRSLIGAGRDGQKTWQDLKAKGIEHIKQSSQSASQTDSRGQPILSNDKFSKTIAALDKEGKLDSLYGKRVAQQLRDLDEIAKAIQTAPPGSVNYSGTASALQVALDSVATFGVTGIPAPAMTVLRESSKYIRNRNVRARIRESLNQK